MNKKKLRNLFRENALKNRTKAEIWAEEILLKHFQWFDFIPEYIYKFRRFDFYFPPLKIAVEIDGGYHNKPKQLQIDLDNDAFLMKKNNVIVMRVPNFDLDRLLEVITQIKRIRATAVLRPKVCTSGNKKLRSIFTKPFENKEQVQKFKVKTILRKHLKP